MRKLINGSLALVAMSVLFTGCGSCFKKMQKKVDTVGITCVPEVLTLQGSNVAANYTLNFPAKYFNGKAILKATPVVTYAGGEVAGAPKFIQGESVQDNYTIIGKTGGQVSEQVSFAFAPNMRQSTLELRVEAKCMKGSKKYREFTPFSVMVLANGVSCVQELADDYARLAMCPDNFKRMTQISKDAKIMFLINKFDVRKDELKKEDIKALEDFVKANSGDPKKTVSQIYAKSYASPDGPLELNNKLSQERGESTKKALSPKFKNERFDIEALGEDWDGFKELVEASNMADKDLILQVLNMYSSPEQRDAEIKNMSAAFQVLAEKILPELRRSKMVVNVDVQGLSDNELKDAVKGNIGQLNLEELMFAATLFEDYSTKASIYKTAADKFNDARAWNNYGVSLVNEGKYADAKTAFEKAAKLNSSSNEIINNLGVVALANGNPVEAKKFFSSINTPEAKYNMGLVNLAEGNYAEAVKALDGYNLAVAQICNGNLASAKSTLVKETSAQADYLKAVVAAREGDANGVVSNLKSAFAKDATLKAVAKTDVEFAKWFGETTFISIVA